MDRKIAEKKLKEMGTCIVTYISESGRKKYITCEHPDAAKYSVVMRGITKPKTNAFLVFTWDCAPRRKPRYRVMDPATIIKITPVLY